MAFRERIEAVLKVKDAKRFKSDMVGAARAVRQLGKSEEKTAAQTELLETILDKLESQSERTAIALEAVAHSVDNMGDQMVQAAAKTAAMNTVMKKSGSNAVFLGKSWAFWKDRLSLTRSEILTTAITISVYFLPAIIAMGSSFANAALGGGAVAGAGLASLLLGLGLLSTLIRPLSDDISKVTKAQEQYNLAVEQYGAASSQASRASAHMGAVIRTHGGKDTVKAVTALDNMKKAWDRMTRPGQKSIMDIMLGGTGALRSVFPTLAKITNQMASSLVLALQPAFRAFSGPDIQKGIGALGRIFTKSIGPGIQGAVNVITVFARIVRASAPHVITWAKAWERTTDSWVKGTADQTKVEKFINKAVRSFKLWWRFAKALGRTLKIVFGVSKDEGDKVVIVLTEGVDALNEWLTMMRDTGAIERFWQSYNDSISDAFDLIQHPEDWLAAATNAIDTWLPPVMDAIATTMATHGPTAAWRFLEAFMQAGGWVHFFGAVFLLNKMGAFRAVGKSAGKYFIKPFLAQMGSAFAASIGGEALAGALGQKFQKNSKIAGKASGKAFGRAFKLAFIGSLVFFADDIAEAIAGAAGAENPEDFKPFKNLGKMWEEVGPPSWHIPTPGHWAGGGVIPLGGTGIVGEHGPEIARAGAKGTRIVQMPSLMNTGNFESMINLNIRTSVQIDRREIAKAYNRELAFVTARRGGNPPRTQEW